MGVAISAPVGMTAKARNIAADVRSVQDLLNGIRTTDGGPATKLVVDGLCGPKTQNAIQQFQLKHFGVRLADGRVDPGGQTLVKMNALSQAAGPPLDNSRVISCHPAPGLRNA